MKICLSLRLLNNYSRYLALVFRYFFTIIFLSQSAAAVPHYYSDNIFDFDAYRGSVPFIDINNDARANLLLLKKSNIFLNRRKAVNKEFSLTNNDIFMTNDLQKEIYLKEILYRLDIINFKLADSTFENTLLPDSKREAINALFFAIYHNDSILPEQKKRLYRLRFSSIPYSEPHCYVDPSRLNELFPAFSVVHAYEVYIRGANYLDIGCKAAAEAYFALLVHVSDPWLAETSRYLLSRLSGLRYIVLRKEIIDELNSSCCSTVFDLMNLSSQLNLLSEKWKCTQNSYLIYYPKGQYVSAVLRGKLEYQKFVLDDFQSTADYYETLLNIPTDYSSTISLVQQINSTLLSHQRYDASVNLPLLGFIDALRLLREYSIATSTNSKNKYSKRQLLNRTQQQVHLLKSIGLSELASFLLLSSDSVLQNKHAELIAKIEALQLQIDQAHEPLQFSLWVMLADSYNKLKKYSDAEKIWKRLLIHPQLANVQNAYVQLRLAQSYILKSYALRNNTLQNHIDVQDINLLAQDQFIHNRAIRSLIFMHLDNDALLILESLLNTTSDRNELLQALIKNNLETENYHFLADILSSFGNNPYSNTNPRLSMRLYDKENDQCPNFGRVIARLAEYGYEDTKAAYCLIGFIQNNFDFLTNPYSVSKRAQADFFMRSVKLGHLQKQRANVLKIYEAIYASKSANSEEKAYALEALISCGILSNCSDKAVTIEQRKKWFMKLKNEFPESDYAKNRNVY